MSRNAFPAIEREYAERNAQLEHSRMERKMATCKHESGQRFQMHDSDGCGYYLWVCDQCGFEQVDDMP